MGITLALAGDTMLGRGVAAALESAPPESLFADEVVDAARSADLFVLNLECCVSERGTPWPDPAKPFFFRAPPVAVRALTHLGVSCVTMANNHGLDFSAEGLLDSLAMLADAGIACVGAGPDVAAARAPAVLEAGGARLGVIGVTDHPAGFAATESAPGVAYADLRAGVPAWLTDAIRGLDADWTLVTPHWGPNMTADPVSHVRRAAEALLDARATLVAGHSAHVFHGVSARKTDGTRRAVLYDLGDFLDDYAVDPVLRNDLGLLFLVTIDDDGPARLEALPLKLDYCVTRPAGGEDATWIAERFRRACAEIGTEVAEEGGRMVIDWRASRPSHPRGRTRR